MVSSKEELLKKAYKPGQDALKLHPFYKGKIEIASKVIVRDFNDFAIWYTPGVAEPCKVIAKDREKVYEHTNKWNAVAVVSDGTRVLGLGNIGPEAGLPVMEGKALLFKYLGGVDAYPICLDTSDAEEIIQVVKWIKPSFGGINLEDIEKPKCFYILDRLREEMDIPVWHDDQQGTATIVVAGAINALKLVSKKMSEALVSMVGAGAANIAIARVLITAGVKKKNIIMCDSKGILNTSRKDLEEQKKENPYKWDMCVNSNAEQREGGILECLRDTDICIAASTPGPGTIKKEEVEGMASDSIMFATANPIPEIWPWEAKEAGVRIVATGRSDFPNQINNSLGFPGIFRGTLDVRAKTITDEMCIAAAYELAKTAEDKEISEEYIVPTMDEWEVFPREAVAVGMKAIEQGIAGLKLSRKELFHVAESIIRKAREQTKNSMKMGFIARPPD
ncbi:MAG: NADP-dependent malic enzyme [Candidatus Methanofastidiosia archaeon]